MHFSKIHILSLIQHSVRESCVAEFNLLACTACWRQRMLPGLSLINMDLAHTNCYQSILEKPQFPLNAESVMCVYSYRILARQRHIWNCWTEWLRNLGLLSHIWSHFPSCGGRFSPAHERFKGHAKNTESLTGTMPRTTLRDNFLLSAKRALASLGGP